jgi:D-inositol-3-phosphate glycosyltransferase
VHIAMVSVTSEHRVAIEALSTALAAAGHRLTLFTARGEGEPPAARAIPAGLRVEYLDAAGAERILSAAWRQARPDIVHAHTWQGGAVAAAVASALGIPVVQTFHELGRPRRGRRGPGGALPPVNDDGEAAVARAATRIIATSSAQVFALLELGAHPRAIKLIPCGVDLGRFTPVVRPPRTGAPFRIVTLSRLVPEAGVADVIEALADVDGAELAIGGGGESDDDADARALEALAHARGVGERTMLGGRISRDAVASFLTGADLVVCVPWYDSSGTVALEAMACGIPVIASAVGGHVDAIADGINGIHVAPRSARQLAYAIAALKADAPRRERFARCGVERVTARYGWPRIAAETFDVYAGIAAAGSLARAGR